MLRTSKRPEALDVKKVTPRNNVKTEAIILTDEPPDKRLSQFRELFTRKGMCSKCRKSISSPRGQLAFKESDSKIPQDVIDLLHACCLSCSQNHCRGCWAPISCLTTCDGSPKNGKCAVATCCAESRAIALFETLGGLDSFIMGERATLAPGAFSKPKSKQEPGSGTGYGVGIVASSPKPPLSDGWKDLMKPSSSTADASAKHWDQVITRVFTALVELLPSPHSEQAREYDYVPHPSIGLLLSLSTLPTLLAILLCNDCVADWTARAETYSAMLLLLRVIVDCELTIQVLLERRWEAINIPGLEPWMWGEGEIAWARNKDGLIERSPPLYEHFIKLRKQGVVFMGNVTYITETNLIEGEDDVNQAVSLCSGLIAVGDIIERAVKVLEIRTDDDQSKISPPAIDGPYAEACKDLAFKLTTFASEGENNTGLTYPNYNFAEQLIKTANSTRNPKNQFRIASELATIATSLPPGVWIRVDEVRSDAIKIMIAGPEGTPYEGGLFEFDCFLPLNYPNVPPLMHLRTTGGGSVRFNPNLYPNGTICLSLLGTWSGSPEEQWGPKSTLLQVIVSIQGMILISTPYYNEPDHYQVNPNPAALKSVWYNCGIQVGNVRWAILDWLQSEHLNGIWGEVIRSHLHFKKNKIRERIVEWAAHNSRDFLAYTDTTVPVQNFVEEYDRRIQMLDG